jgi:hypothetical protein
MGLTPGPPRVAYLLLTHEARPQLERLLARLREGSPTAPIVVHHDAARSDPPRAVCARFGADLLTLVEGLEWGGYSIVEAVLRSLEWMTREIGFDWVVVLSGADYPLRPLSEIEAEIAGCGADALIDADTVVDPAVPFRSYDRHESQMRRYFFRWHDLPRILPSPRSAAGRALRRPARRLSRAQRRLHLRPFNDRWRLGVRTRRTPFGPDRPCRYGSQWCTLSQRAVAALLDALRAEPGLEAYYRHTLIPDESLLQTVLCARPELRIDTDHRRFIRWRDGDDHPSVLTVADLPELLASRAHFGRKFDDRVDAAVLDTLDRAIAGAPGPR